MELSHKLRMKLLNRENIKNFESTMEPISMIFRGQSISVPGPRENKLVMNFEDEPDLFKECIMWFKVVGQNYKADVGEYIGLFPISYDLEDMTVTFNVDIFESGRKHWKDWFIV